ncbi:hypothetical protein BD324DRAFT_626496 [Kockovaella imperatae]|uniref:Uncharacterized protein n=1 Tax=Kockovaella imperatae TaxID=4999 RepID=A0A1Y1UGH1_9TREE|nr:hypothetical protein BD324DRAFT_626496 [Kockovaella imperatae]ORX36606.1 hypothetical protein BD324DRAFT_626496 [Kockovaella imperatae]
MTQYQKPPPPGIRRILWAVRLKFEAMTAIAMLETWEKLLVYCLLFGLICLFWWSFLHYSPSHYAYLSRRCAYYIWGDESLSPGHEMRTWIWNHLGGATGRAAEPVAAVGKGVKIDL